MHPITFISALLFSFATTTSFADDEYTIPSNCNWPFDCGPFKNLSHPFTTGAQPTTCGPPEFQLSKCNDDSPELTIAPLSYRVLRLNHTEKTMTLAQSDLWNNTCLTKEFTNTTTLNSSTVLNFSVDNEDLTIYYGCSTSFTTNARTPSNQFNCSSMYGNNSAGFYLTGPVPTDPVLNITACSVGVTVKILRTVASDVTSNRTTLREALMEGFNVNFSDKICGNQLCPTQGSSSGGIQPFFKILTGVLAGAGAIAVVYIMMTIPANRPSMTKVVEMLEGNVHSIEIPPKPFLFSPTRSVQNSSTASLS
ncbi:LEAF RUST 10 DISEASE-RESISTANCE LOCUS RECEPTOR-LIKE PROTEIN KINASE-like 2.1 [Fagus crenata]